MSARAGVLFGTEARRRFLGRQFAAEHTAWQTAFDITFGIALPVVCLALDPILFRRGGVYGGMLGYAKPFVYTAIFLQMAGLAYWLRERQPSRVLAGWLAGGACFAGLLGIVLLPLSLIALMIGIGALGLCPLFTAFVFARNARRALEAAGPAAGRRKWEPLGIGFVLGLGIPLTAQVMVNRAVEDAIADVASGRPERVEPAIRRLSLLHEVADDGSLMAAWRSEDDPERKDVLATAYERVSGYSIDEVDGAD
jgi:hypothetical protein